LEDDVSDEDTSDMPPRAVLYGVYAFLFIVLIAVFVIVAVYV
jgi:hypothetical protein